MTTDHLRHRPADFRTPGFTLMEIVIVLVILSIAAGMAGWSWGTGNSGRTDPLRQEADGLHALLAFASDYALAHQQDVGLAVTDHDYALLLLGDDGTWHEFGGEGYRKTLPADMRIALDDQASSPDMPSENGEPPAVLVDPDGTISPCRIAFQWRHASKAEAWLTADSAGDLRVELTSGAPNAAP